jgi:hypothetical protein
VADAFHYILDNNEPRSLAIRDGKINVIAAAASLFTQAAGCKCGKASIHSGHRAEKPGIMGIPGVHGTTALKGGLQPVGYSGEAAF